MEPAVPILSLDGVKLLFKTAVDKETGALVGKCLFPINEAFYYQVPFKGNKHFPD